MKFSAYTPSFPGEIVGPARMKIRGLQQNLSDAKLNLSKIELDIVVAESKNFHREWRSKPLKLNRVDTSRINDCVKTVRQFDFEASGVPDLMAEAQVLLVEHDWLALIKKSPEFADGEWCLPFDDCVFEFNVTGVHVIVWITHGVWLKFWRIKRHQWECARHPLVINDGKLVRKTPSDLLPDDLDNFLFEHVKACAIMLDSGVAETKPNRVDHRSNEEKPERVPLPKFSYHVISLVRRGRPERLPQTEGSATKDYTRKRLHFRRGHWRRYESHKTWLKWMLVGDPDLGFIDKDYKAVGSNVAQRSSAR